MSELVRALVPLRRAEGESETRVTAEPFEQFVAGLYARRTAATTTMAGSAQWLAFPIEHALADGLWPVMLRVADKLGHSMVTERQTVADIAPRVNRLINAGLVIAYSSIDEACAAFTREVIDSVYAASRGMSGSASDILQVVWQMPVAKFFAALLRAAQEYGDEVQRIGAFIRERNDADERLTTTFVNDSFLLDIDERWVRFFHLDEVTVRVPDDDPYMVSSTLLLRLKHIVARQRALRCLPLRLQTLPDDAITTAGSIDEQWMRTQLLLAAADLPDREYLRGDEFTGAVTAVAEREAGATVTSFFDRMDRRGMRADQRERECLDALAREALAGLRLRKPGEPVTLDLQAMNSLFLVVKPEHITFDRDAALRVALGDDAMTTEMLAEMSPGAQNAYLRRQIFPAIIWNALTVDDIRHMAQDGPFPMTLLVEGVEAMESDARDQAIEWLLQADMMTQDAVGHLITCGALEVTADFLQLHYRKMPEALLAEHLPEFLRRIGDDTEASRALSPATILNMFNMISSDAARKVIDTPTVREPLVMHVITEILDTDHRVSRDVTENLFADFVACVGADRWYRLALSAEIVMRAEDYARGRDQGAGQMMPRWNDLAGRLAILHNLPKWLGLTRKRTQKILRTYAEDDVFAWLYAGRDDLDERLAVYRAARDRYYK